jgi:hypothetical protein
MECSETFEKLSVVKNVRKLKKNLKVPKLKKMERFVGNSMFFFFSISAVILQKFEKLVSWHIASTFQNGFHFTLRIHPTSRIVSRTLILPRGWCT